MIVCASTLNNPLSGGGEHCESDQNLYDPLSAAGGYDSFDSLPTIGSSSDTVDYNHGWHALQARAKFASNKNATELVGVTFQPSVTGTGSGGYMGGMRVNDVDGSGPLFMLYGMWCSFNPANYATRAVGGGAAATNCIYDTSGGPNFIQGSLQFLNNVYINNPNAPGYLGGVGTVVATGQGSFGSLTTTGSGISNLSSTGGVSIAGGGSNPGNINAYTNSSGTATALLLNNNGGNVCVGKNNYDCGYALGVSNSSGVVTAGITAGGIVNGSALTLSNFNLGVSGTNTLIQNNYSVSTGFLGVTGYGGYQYYNSSTGAFGFYGSTTSATAGSTPGNPMTFMTITPTGTGTAAINIPLGVTLTLNGSPISSTGPAFLASNFSTSSTSFVNSGLSMPTIPINTTVGYKCTLFWGNSNLSYLTTLAVSFDNAPSAAAAQGHYSTSPNVGSAVYSMLTSVGSTTAMQLLAHTPDAGATANPAFVTGSIKTGASTVTPYIAILTSNASYQATLYAGSTCAYDR
jgi:hypothetical protein